MPTKKADSVTVAIPETVFGRVQVNVVGTTPFICHRMSEKAKRELLLPTGRKTAADRAASLKHDPYREFRDSFYTSMTTSGDALLGVPSSAFKGVMTTAALDVPGSSKAQIGRLVQVSGYMRPLFGVPRLMMSVVRSADISKTPDVRTRAILPEWACWFEVEFVIPTVNETSVMNLLNTGGRTAGVGDWRAEKGKGNFGQFRLCNADDPDFVRIRREGGRAQQEAAVAQPDPFDQETADMLEWFCGDMLEWFCGDVKRRGKQAS